MSLLKRIFGILFGLIVVAFGIGFLLPAQVHVERQIVINAPPEQVFQLISDFHQWDAWSPWANIDPNATMEVTGSGVGQKMVWASDNADVGRGSQEITQLAVPTSLTTHLEFDGQSLADASFNLAPEDGMTRVIWSLDSNVRQNTPFLFQPISSYAGLLLDPLVGKDYETGLQNLKQIAEGNKA